MVSENQPEYPQGVIEEFIRRMLQRERPGVDKTAATLYMNLINALKKVPGLTEQLDEFAGSNTENQVGFGAGGEHWTFISNKAGHVGDFRIIRGRGEPEEEGLILIGQETDNRFSFWQKSFGLTPGGIKVFRGPNDPAARRIQGMIEKINPD